MLGNAIFDHYWWFYVTWNWFLALISQFFHLRPSKMPCIILSRMSLLCEQNHPWAAGGRGAIQTSVLASSIVAMASSLQNKPRQNRFQQNAIHCCHGVSVEGHCRPWYQETGGAVKVFISLNYGGSLLFTLRGVNYCRNIETGDTRDYILEFLQSSTSK